MKCSLRSFGIFLEASVSRAMGCFIGCFLDGDDDDDDEDGDRRFAAADPSIPAALMRQAVTPKDHCRNKSVRFQCDSSSKSSSDSKSSPFPTPVKLSEEMQTPGTTFMTNIEDVVNGKKTRIRSQVVSSNTDHLLSETLARKEAMHVGKLILFGEDEEDVAALPQFRSFVRYGKSVASF